MNQHGCFLTEGKHTAQTDERKVGLVEEQAVHEPAVTVSKYLVLENVNNVKIHKMQSAVTVSKYLVLENVNNVKIHKMQFVHVM